MVTCKADPSLVRLEIDGFKFPLGSYPVEPMKPKSGYSVQFEPADGGDNEGDWEEWPDRYVFDAVISAERVEALCRMLFALLPGRAYPILDVLGRDAYREIDPYIAYDLVGMDRFADLVRRYRDFLYEDGLVGFGAMSEEPFLYVFADEHKIVTVRAEPALKDKVEKVLQAFDLEPLESPAGADAAAHEHRGVLLVPDDNPDLLGPEEIVERLRDGWQLVLNIDPETNVDDDGKDLGETPWRCVARCEIESKPSRYAEVILMADCLKRAEETAYEALEEEAINDNDEWEDVVIVESDRMKPEQLEKPPPPAPKRKRPKEQMGGGTVISVRWLPA